MPIDFPASLRRREFLALVVLAAACGGSEDIVLMAQGVSREVPANPPLAEVVRGLTAFGHNLYAAAAKPGTNTVISPLSIAYAFGMARAGAAGATAAALDKAFGFPAAGPHTAFNALTRKIVTVEGVPPEPTSGGERDTQNSEPADPVVGIANGLFAQRDLPIKQPFLRTLAAQYGMGVRTVDFRKDATAVIDAWAEEQTAGRIKKLFDQLDETTRLVIANAVYLKADWEHSFAGEGREENAAFTREDGSTVRTKLMRQTTDLRYASGADWQAVELPYAKSDLAMWVLLPARGGSPGALLKPDMLAQVGAGLKPATVTVVLPGWDFATDLDLEAPLRALGLGVLFDGADFSGIADRIYLGQAVHRANISVDEWGTEAAAVTGLAFPTSGRAGAVTEFRADHAFAFAIMHRSTSTPLFIGHVTDPTASA
ncbi:serpin family protein [Nonomuraea basaltis]|uniref:serpin family protein n=1 Tax=Nonomuraea basaltis TaxID=2495887 RepID=UPI00110C6189|nr:serpin family protein [Nonomuraea basaltis]TMR91699.1 serpin family protein [Nonomuraea basaltis]